MLLSKLFHQAIVRLFSATVVLFSGGAQAQAQISADEYIKTYSEEAVKQMNEHGIPASVILAQAIFESGFGKSSLALRSNNHFGIKCHSVWQGDTVVKTDDTLNECFRKYASVQDSYTDHSLFLISRPWYKPLFSLSLSDYRSWCYGLKQAGYATYPRYAEELIRIIKKYQLNKFDGPEKMACRQLAETQKEIKQHTVTPQVRTSDLATSDLLFSNEHDFVLKSLELLLAEAEDSRIMVRK